MAITFVELADTGEGTATLRALTGTGSEAVYAAGDGALAPLTGAAYSISQRLSPLVSTGFAVAGAQGNTVFAPLTSDAYEGVSPSVYNIGQGILMQLSGAGLGLTGGIVANDGGFQTLQALKAEGANYAYSDGYGQFSALTATAIEFLFSPDLILSESAPHAEFYTRHVAGLRWSSTPAGTTGLGDGSLRPLQGEAANYAYSDGYGVFSALTGSANEIALPLNQILSQSAPHAEFHKLHVASLQWTSTAVGHLVFHQQSVANLSLSAVSAPHFTGGHGSEVSTALFETFSSLFLGLGALRQTDDETWVFNGDTFAPSRYSYAFDSLVSHQGVCYGANENGIYALGGSDDEGTPIASLVVLRRERLGGRQRARLARVYLSGASEGPLSVRVADDSGAVQRAETVEALGSGGQARAKLGLGVTSVYHQIAIANIDGGDFTLDGLELLAQATERKVRA